MYIRKDRVSLISSFGFFVVLYFLGINLFLGVLIAPIVIIYIRVLFLQFPAPVRLMLIYCGVYLISICINIFFNYDSHYFDQIDYVASLFNILNLSIFFLPFLCFWKFKNSFEYRTSLITTTFSIVVVFFAVLYSYSSGVSDVEFRSFIGLFVNLQGESAISSVDDIIIVRHDWLYGDFPRITLFSRYPAGSSLILAVMLSLYSLRCFTARAVIIFEIVFFIVVLYMGSRSVYLPYMLCMGLFLVARGGKIFSLLFAFMGGIIALSVIYSNFDDILIFWQEARSGSSSIRSHLYSVALTYTGFSEFLIGNGGKATLLGHSIKIGSHSSLIGSYFKTGLAGLFVFTLFWISLLARAALHFVRSTQNGYHDFVKFRMLIIISIWLLFEDLDADPFISFSIGMALLSSFILEKDRHSEIALVNRLNTLT